MIVGFLSNRPCAHAVITPAMQTRWKPRDYAAALVLFVATFAFVLWQNHRVAIIWDLSYILDSAYRVSIGQVLYRDLPFAHAPLTFLLQAAIMRITGRIIFHHILYAATAGALGTVLTWRIGLRILKSVRDGWLMATLLAAPLAVAGIYSILPIPFYDCDCVLSILAGLYLLYTLNAHSSARPQSPYRCSIDPAGVLQAEHRPALSVDCVGWIESAHPRAPRHKAGRPTSRF